MEEKEIEFQPVKIRNGGNGDPLERDRAQVLAQRAGAEAQAEMLTLANVDEAFTFQPWDAGQVERGEAVRDALVLAAKQVLRNCPAGRLRTRALNNLIDARMLANAAITFKGRF
jgi:hypothetical protein